MLGRLPFLLAPLLVLGSVWLPEVAYVSAPTTQITPGMVAAIRSTPDDGVLRELAGFSLLPVRGRSTDVDVRVAEGILQGRLQLPDGPSAAITPRFAPEDFDHVPAALQLLFAGWIVPDVLLAAYVSTGREDFFATAAAYIRGWDRYERGPWPLPKGFLWNDHAVAARVRVLAEFWRIYRTRPDFDEQVGGALLEQAARYGYFLSSPSHFTFATNHGLMQNLALLELRAAFPSLPAANDYRAIALERLGRQLELLVEPSGVIRENSPGYQAFDVAILAMIFRSMTLLDEPVPLEWARRYEACLTFLADLLRPDGTLPAIGDTDGAAGSELPPVTAIDGGVASPLHPYQRSPATSERLEAGAGYWIARRGLAAGPSADALSQTVVAWPSPPVRGHKHADEMSVHLWAEGVSWLTGVGYWPYDLAGRESAESWLGANAPHLAGEAATSDRETRLLRHGSDSMSAVLDLERTGPGDYSVRRQVVIVSPDAWVILDTWRDGSAETQSVWTMAPEVNLDPDGPPGSYVLRAASTATSYHLDFVGSGDATFEQFRASADPVLGWHVVNGTPQPASALVVEQPAGNGWQGAVITRRAEEGRPGSSARGPLDSRVTSAEDWAFTLATDRGDLVIRRSGDRIEMTGQAMGGGSHRLDLEPGPDVTGAQKVIDGAFQSLASDYPQFRSQPSRRTAVSFGILGLVVAQEVVMAIVRRRWPNRSRALNAASLLCWLVLAVILGTFVVQSWEVLNLGGG
jgi:hypothetical protein